MLLCLWETTQKPIVNFAEEQEARGRKNQIKSMYEGKHSESARTLNNQILQNS